MCVGPPRDRACACTAKARTSSHLSARLDCGARRASDPFTLDGLDPSAHERRVQVELVEAMGQCSTRCEMEAEPQRHYRAPPATAVSVSTPPPPRSGGCAALASAPCSAQSRITSIAVSHIVDSILSNVCRRAAPSVHAV